ncbi:MAG: hypothetical protein KY464_10500 [Gemmatimonadetes bacterium]|nr:hypothetical protein [Gemmatimonadota bacterium]
MRVPTDLQEHSICSMFRDGVSVRMLEVAFDRTGEEIVEVLCRRGVLQPAADESREAILLRIRQDVRHQAA